MSEKNKNTEPEVPDFVKKVPELLPVWDWWVKDGRSTVLTLAIAGLAVAGFFGWRHWRSSQAAAARAALDKMLSPEATIETKEEVVTSYGSSKAGPMMRIDLARSYFDDDRFEDALAVYEELVKESGNIPAIADIARVGRAFALEGIASLDEEESSRPAKYKTAAEAFAEFASNPANTNSYLILDAKLGAARCKALSGDKDGAAKDFDALVEQATDEAVKERIKNMSKSASHFKQRARLPASVAAPELKTPAAPAAPAKPEAKAPAAPVAPAKPEMKAPAAPKPELKAPAKPEAKAPAAPAAPAKPEAKAPAAPAAPAKPEAKAPAAPAKPAAPAPAPAKPAAK